MHPQAPRVLQGQAVRGALGRQSRVGQEDDRVVDVGQRVQDGAQALGVVSRTV